MDRLYGALIRLAWAVVIPYQSVIALLRRSAPPRLMEKLGRPADVRAGGIWVHAVSVGEVRLALALIARLRRHGPRLAVHLTTSTETGRTLAEAARSSDPAHAPDTLSALPFDLPGPMSRLLDRLRPRLLLIVETELWPNLLRLGPRRGLPIALVNGRISPRTFPRYRLFRPFLSRALQGVWLFAMQSEEDADRVRRLGAPAERVRVTGNLKYDLAPPGLDIDEARRRLALPAAAPLFVAGSTAAGEEGPVADAFLALRRHDASSRLAIAPRHPEDLPRADAALRARGLRVLPYSRLSDPTAAGPSGSGDYDALLVDVVGVLPEVYAAADLAFVGGSLVPRGGQNLMEPAALGKPVLFGPQTRNFQAAAAALIRAGGGFVVRNGDELGSAIVRLTRDRDAARVAGERALGVVRANRGALERTLDLLEPMLRAPAAPHGRQAAAP